MGPDGVLDAMLSLIAEQRTSEAHALVAASADPCAEHLGSFTAFMGDLDPPAPAAPRTDDPGAALLATAVVAMLATKDPHPDGEAALVMLPDLADAVDPATRRGAFARYVASEAALAAARLDLARQLQAVTPAPHEVWASHLYAPVMLACAARTEIFAGNISTALALIEGAAGEGMPWQLVRATHALAAGNAADVETMRALVTEVSDAETPAVDHLGRGIHMLLAFSVIALGDTRGAVVHLLRAGGGADLEHLTVIDRVLGYELLVAAAVGDDDLESALAWEQRALPWAEQRVAAPTVARIRSRVALLAGDPAAAELFAADAVTLAAAHERQIERAEGEIVRARARVAERLPNAIQDLRTAVAEADQTGHAAVRASATKVLRPARRRLPPPAGAGWTSLSARERDVADLILLGSSNADIAATLSLSPTTVRAHTTRVLAAYGVATRIAFLAGSRAYPTDPVVPTGITKRQADVAALVAAGRSNVEIGASLGISLKSAERHVSDILFRWELASRFDLAQYWWAAQSNT